MSKGSSQQIFDNTRLTSKDLPQSTQEGEDPEDVGPDPDDDVGGLISRDSSIPWAEASAGYVDTRAPPSWGAQLAPNKRSLDHRYPFLEALKTWKDFSDLERVLTTWTQRQKRLRSSSKIIPLCAAICLAMNDYFCMIRGRGKLRHTWGNEREPSSIIYASIHWTINEAEEYAKLAPLQKLRLCSVWSAPWWNNAHLHVVTVKVLPPQECNDCTNDCYSFTFNYHGIDLQRNDLVLLWLPTDDFLDVGITFGEVILVPIKTILASEMLTPTRDRSRGPWIEKLRSVGEAPHPGKTSSNAVIKQTALHYSEAAAGCVSWRKHWSLKFPAQESLHNQLIGQIHAIDGTEEDKLFDWASLYDWLLPGV